MIIPVEILPSFLAYTAISAITPGPANITSLGTALKYGRKIALKQWLGIFSGYGTVSLTAAIFTFFLGTAFAKYVQYLSFVGAAYLLWLAVHPFLPAKKSAENNEIKKSEPSFITGYLLQLTNVKIILSCISTLTTFVLPYHQDFPSIFFVSIFLSFTGPSANLIWIFTGVALQKLFQNHKRLIDLLMAIALIACAISLFL